MAGALAVEHVLDVHEAALVRVLVDCGRRRRHERVRAIRARRQRHHLGALEEAPVVDHGAVRCKVGTVRPQAQRAALAVHLHTIDRRAHHVLVGSVVVGSTAAPWWAETAALVAAKPEGAGQRVVEASSRPAARALAAAEAGMAVPATRAAAAT
eukprot:scaffold44165_cov57-Phaeocystis_antarctica.AAC.6